MANRREIRHSTEVAGHVVTRASTRTHDDRLIVTFTVSGPEASPRFPKEHVILLRPGDGEKLNSRGGHGGYDEDGTAFFEWHFDWPGGDGVHVIYVEAERGIVDREWVEVSAGGTTGGHTPSPHVGDHPHGAYLSAYPPDGYVESSEEDFTIAGTVIEFTWDYGVRLPLWDAEGLLPEEPAWLRQALGLSDELIRDLADWGGAMDHLDGHPSMRTDDAFAELDVRARALVERLRIELGPRFEVTYRPW